MSYAQRKELSGNRTLAIIFMVVVLQFALVLRDRHRPCLQRHQEGGRGPEDVRRRGAAAATGEAAATAEGHAEGAAAADDAAAAGADEGAAAADPDGDAPHSAGDPAGHAHRRRRRRRRRRARCRRRRARKGDLRTPVQRRRLSGLGARPRAQGTAQAQLTIGPDGRVTGCNLIRSTGNSALEFSDLQHPAPPREVHARRATATAMRRPTRSRRRRSCGDLRRLTVSDSETDFRRKAQSCKQHPPQQFKSIWPDPRSPAGRHHRHLGVHHPRHHVDLLVLHPLHQADAAAEDHQPGPQGPRELLELAEPSRSRDQARGEERLSRDRRRRACSRRTSTAS